MPLPNMGVAQDRIPKSVQHNILAFRGIGTILAFFLEHLVGLRMKMQKK